MERVLIYGASGYTGALIAEQAVREGSKPILSGRSETKIRPLAERLDCPHRIANLDDAKGLDAALEGVDVVLNCAGPFSRTATAMVDACLRNRSHYLDITGEIDVFEAVAARDTEAKAAEIMLLPGVGFDVVPTDCLAAHLAAQIESPTHLTTAFAGTRELSHGTSVSSIEALGRGSAVRREGKLIYGAAAAATRDFELGGEVQTCVTIPWGDISTVYHGMGIPNIEVFMAAPAGIRRFMKATRFLGPLLRMGAVQRFLEKRVPAGGPDQNTRAAVRSHMYAKVSNAAGESAEARMETPESYELTIFSALLSARRAAQGDTPVGFQTPSTAYGADFVLELDGVSRS